MLDLLQQFADWIWAGIEWLTGWAPGEHIKNVLEWIGAVLGAGLSLWGVVALFRGGGAATKQDVGEVAENLSAVGNELEALRNELRRKHFESQTGAGGIRSSFGGPSSQETDDLAAGVNTLLEAGREEALRDQSGTAAEEAIDQLITERAKARLIIAKDEAALYRQKGIFSFLHDSEAAMRAYAKAAELDPDDPETWNRLGQLQVRVGDLNRARQSFENLREISEKLANKKWLAIAIGNLGQVYLNLGHLDEAQSLITQDLHISEELAHHEGATRASGNLGVIYFMRGQLEEAANMFEKALHMAETSGNKEQIANALGNLGLVFLEDEQFERAKPLLMRTFEIAEEIGNKTQQADVLGNLAMAYLASDDLEKAKNTSKRALHFYEELNSKDGQARVYGNLGSISKRNGDLPTACEYWSEALKLFRQIGMAREIDQTERLMREAGCSKS